MSCSSSEAKLSMGRVEQGLWILAGRVAAALGLSLARNATDPERLASSRSTPLSAHKPGAIEKFET